MYLDQIRYKVKVQFSSVQFTALLRQRPQLQLLCVTNPSESEPESERDGSWMSAVPSVWPPTLQRFCIKSGRFCYDVERKAEGTVCNLHSWYDMDIHVFAAAVGVIPSLTAAALSNCGLTDAHLAALFKIQPQVRLLRISDRLPIATLLSTIATAPASLRALSSSELELFVDRTDRHLRLQVDVSVSPALLLPVLDRYPDLLHWT